MAVSEIKQIWLSVLSMLSGKTRMSWLKTKLLASRVSKSCCARVRAGDLPRIFSGPPELNAHGASLNDKGAMVPRNVYPLISLNNRIGSAFWLVLRENFSGGFGYRSSFRMMQRLVLRFAKDDKVFDPIVVLYVIDVVDMLIRFKRTTKMLFHQIAMLAHNSSVDAYENVAIRFSSCGSIVRMFIANKEAAAAAD